MKLSDDNHLMYCLNIHPGENWGENLAAIQQFALKVKAGFCPDAPFALGLRLSAQAARELLPRLEEFSTFLKRHNLYAVTINGFPYGSFHGAAIKEKVYLPDWSTKERVAYTLNLAMILANILPEGEVGTISTVPGHYGKSENPSIVANLLLMAHCLAGIEKKTGKHIVLALEPEPDCYLDRLDSILHFFRKLFATGESRKYLGICLDTCHAIVEFESPLFWLQTLTRAGIQVPKIQISAALRAVNPQRKTLLPFADPEYLHQTRVLSEGNLLRFRDLPEALVPETLVPETLGNAGGGEWRVHFHVPLTWAGEGRGESVSTADLIEDDFFGQLHVLKGKHLEVETYSYRLLPGPKAPVTDSIIRELQWVMGKLDHLSP